MNAKNKIRVKACPPFTAAEEGRMLNAKVDAAIYMLERSKYDNIYQQRMDEKFPENIMVMAMLLSGLSIERIGLHLNMKHRDIRTIIRLYNLSNETRCHRK